VIDPTSGTNGSNSASNNTPAATPRTDNLGRDAFLRLLTTQLAHQDPVQPQADSEFIAQLATFSSLEQLTGMRETLDAIAKAFGVGTTDGTGTDDTGTDDTTDDTTAPPSGT
jgi:flagellar basal-body rod modification protein FlgD